MRKWLFVLLLVGAVAIAGCAKEAEARGGGDPCDSFLGAVLNECSPHTVDTDTWRRERKAELEAGVGADVVLWENETEKVKFIEEVVAEYKYDINNQDHSVYGVVRLNLWQKIKNLFKKDEGE